MSSSRRSVDRESRKPKVTQKKKQDVRPPSPIVQSESDTDENLASELSQGEDDTIRQIVSKPSSKKVSTKKRITKKKTLPSTEDQEDPSADESSDHKVVPHLAYLFSLSAHLGADSFEFRGVSQFIPSFWNFFYVLDNMQNMIYDNKYLLRTCPYYMSYFTTIYYGILLGVHVLRARSFAGAASSTESKFLRSFEKLFPLETLPVASPLAGFFEVLGALKPADDRYNWIVPSMPCNADGTHAYGTVVNTPQTRGSARFPALPHLFTLLRFFENWVNLDINDPADEYFLLPADGTTNTEKRKYIDGFVIQNRATVNFLNKTPGFQEPLFAQDKYSRIKKFIKGMDLPTPVYNKTYNTTEDYLLMNREWNPTWFTELIKIASVEASFFDGSTNLSKISPSADRSIYTTQMWYGNLNLTELTADTVKLHTFVNTRIIPNSGKCSIYSRDPDITNEQMQLAATSGLNVNLKHADFGDVQFNAGVSGPMFVASAESNTEQNISANQLPPISKYIESFRNPIFGAQTYLIGKLYLEKGKK